MKRVEVNFFINIYCVFRYKQTKAHRNWRCEIQRNVAEAITKKGRNIRTCPYVIKKIIININWLVAGDWSLKMVGNSQESWRYIRKKNPN
jgi:hypothetical protein